MKEIAADVYFEDAQSPKISNAPKHRFYCFYTEAKDLPIAPHWHYYIEMLYVIDGMGQIIINGDTLTMSEGDLLFSLPKDVHSINTLGTSPFKYAVIKFDPEILYDASYDTFILKHITPVISPVPPKSKYYKSGQFKAYEDILTVMDIFDQKPYGYEFMVKSKLLSFYNLFVNDLKAKGIDLLTFTLDDADYSSILSAFEYIHHNFAGDCRAEEVAKHCHLSYSYFSRQFKKVSGITFTKYLNFVRITEAERLLIKKNMSITDIGFTVGFKDTSYFIRQFKTFKQYTPKQFLKIIGH